MEEVSKIQTAIEEIIIDNTYPAKEIADMFERFIEWATDRNKAKSHGWFIAGKWMTVQELFTYWQKEINK